MSVTALILIAAFLPFAGAALIALAGPWPNLREGVGLTVAAITAAAVLALLEPVMAGARPELTIIELLPGLSIAFTLEPLGMLFACIASVLWIVTTVYAIGYMRGHHEENQTRFFVCFAIAIGAAVSAAFSGNMLTLFVFYEVLTLSTYPLVTHHGTEAAKHGGRVYLGILMATSIGFLLPAVVWTFHLAGTLDFRAGGILAGTGASELLLSVLLLLYVFGVGKAALMPFHRWLPAAMVAPTPVSALLHAVAVVKAGVFSVLKIAVFVFGIDLMAELTATRLLAWVAAFTILAASLVAMRQDNLKRRLAYSTVSQLSYIILGAMMATASGVLGGGLHIATHALGKITLFFCAGAIMVAAHKTEISQMGGLGRAMPITMTAFLLGALSIIGLPPFGGVWSKWYLALGALDGEQLAFVAVLMVSSLLNVAYLLPIPIRAFFGKPPDDEHDDEHAHHHPSNGFHEAPWTSVAALSFTALACLVLFFFPQPVIALLAPLVGR